MTTTSLPPAEPPPDIRFKRRYGIVSGLRELWRYRELIRTLSERELRARYKQTALGFAWAFITPLLLMFVFTFVFKRVGNVDTSGVPYVLFSYLGLLPWTFFSTSLNQGGTTLLSNVSLLNKVYCPREVFPIASMSRATVDLGIAVIPLVLLFVVNGFVPRATSVWIPLLFVIQFAFTLGVTLAIAAIVIYLRDVRQGIPLIVQVGLWATPVGYALDAIPERVRLLYSIANPLGPLIDAYRRTVLYGLSPDWSLLGPATASSFAFLVFGYVLFKRLETGIADVA